MASETSPPYVSIIIPAYNEAPVIGQVLDELLALPLDQEIIVIDDGSTDGTGDIARQRAKVYVIEQAYNIGNGAAIKAGIRAARGSVMVMMDGDGQHRPQDIPRLLECLPRYDMVVGARSRDSETELHRDVANRFYSALATYLVGRQVLDLTSGFRALKTSIAKQFVNLLPNGFSYPTTLTLALFRSGHTVHYVPILAKARVGRSKIKLLYDGLGFVLTLMRIGTLFVPLRIFLPVATSFFGTGVLYGVYLLTFQHRFSNMAVLLILSGIMLFMLGLISEQIALLRMMQATSHEHEHSS